MGLISAAGNGKKKEKAEVVKDWKPKGEGEDFKMPKDIKVKFSKFIDKIVVESLKRTTSD